VPAARSAPPSKRRCRPRNRDATSSRSRRARAPPLKTPFRATRRCARRRRASTSSRRRCRICQRALALKVSGSRWYRRGAASGDDCTCAAAVARRGQGTRARKGRAAQGTDRPRRTAKTGREGRGSEDRDAEDRDAEDRDAETERRSEPPKVAMAPDTKAPEPKAGVPAPVETPKAAAPKPPRRRPTRRRLRSPRRCSTISSAARRAG
jgi:hypothetical protein